MSRLFINRPIFAWVLAIIVMLGGIGALFALPIEQYPDIAPTQVNIRASYPGASAEAIENSVTQVLEQQLTGIDGLLYFSSQSSARGQANITAIFAKGTDPDIAQVQVQNKIQSAISRLPAQVQQQGVRVTKSNSDTLLLVGIYDATDTRANTDIADYMTSNVQDPLSRVEGVGDVNIFGAPHAMRIWLNPQRLAAVSLMPSDVIAAITAQNSEVAAGEVGGLPSPEGQMLNATVTAQSRLQTVEQFENIVLKTLPDGSSVRIKDIARVEIGAENYSLVSRINGHPGAGMAISLSPGSDALETAERVKARMVELAADFPDGLTYSYANDSTAFIKLSVSEVQKSLIEAILLVIIVMFVFLQSWRAVLIPAIAVPVVLLGTFAIFYIAGFQHQHADPVRADAGDRAARRRRDRRGRKCRATDGRKSGHVGARRDDPVDEGIAGRADRDRAGAVGGVPADGLFRRIDRGHLSSVFDHDHFRDDAVRAGSADPQSRR